MLSSTKGNNSRNLTEKDVRLYIEHLKQWEKSGISQAGYCNKHSINYNTFVYVKSKHCKNKKIGNKFIEVSSVINKLNSSPANVLTNVVATKDNKFILIKLLSKGEIEIPASLSTVEMGNIFKALRIIE